MSLTQNHKKNDKNSLRQLLRGARRKLSARQQQSAARAIAKCLSHQLHFRKAKRIGFYIAADGELSPHLLLDLACKLGKQCYLPVLHPFRKGYLHFAEAKTNQKLQPNRFGIPEPSLRNNRIISAKDLDCVFVPLVGFDRSGNRLGMGGGFYDRSFANNQSRRRLIGVAHSIQEVEQLNKESWDIPLQGIVTEKEYIPV